MAEQSLLGTLLKDAVAKCISAQAVKDMSVIMAYICKATPDHVGDGRLGYLIPLSEFDSPELHKGISWNMRIKALAQLAPDTLFAEYNYLSGFKRIDCISVSLRQQ